MKGKNTFGVHFILRPNKNEDGKFSVYARIVVNGTRDLAQVFSKGFSSGSPTFGFCPLKQLVPEYQVSKFCTHY